MLDIKLIESDYEYVKGNLLKRGFNIAVLEEIVSLNKKRRELLQIVEANRAEVKSLSKEIGPLKKKGEDTSVLMNKVATIKEVSAGKEKELAVIEKNINDTLAGIPNLISDDVPVGKNEDANIELRRWGEPKKFEFVPKNHDELGEALGGLDFESGAKITASRFLFYKGQIAKLERALINYFLDEHSKHGYVEMIPPFIVNADTMFATGQLPKFADDLFKIEGRDWYLIPTAEVPLTNLKRGDLFLKSELPMMSCAATPCFRSEAGSYGKDTKGLIRLHQFNKVEMVNIVEPDKSEEAHKNMVARATDLLEKLGLPYREMLLCSGDIGFSAKRCIDLEVWLPGQQKYREISSISNCGDFQARRASIRYRGDDGRPEFAHTLNGSGLAVGRTVVAIIENYQEEDGTIAIPEVLRSYMGGAERIGTK